MPAATDYKHELTCLKMEGLFGDGWPDVW